jgi:hypothetical protein
MGEMSDWSTNARHGKIVVTSRLLDSAARPPIPS